MTDTEMQALLDRMIAAENRAREMQAALELIISTLWYDGPGADDIINQEAISIGRAVLAGNKS